MPRPRPIRAYTLVLAGQRLFFVQFNEPLELVPAGDVGNWQWFWGGYLWGSNSVQIGASLVQLRPVRGAPSPGPDRISYDPPPQDVRALSDARPALAFTDYPIT